MLHWGDDEGDDDNPKNRYLDDFLSEAVETTVSIGTPVIALISGALAVREFYEALYMQNGNFKTAAAYAFISALFTAGAAVILRYRYGK